MKKNNILLAFLAVILFFGACSDFEEINKDPNAANEDDINCLLYTSLLVRDLFTFGNAKNNINAEREYSEKKINSLFGTVQLNYGGYFFIDGTFRNDWSSTLHPDNRSLRKVPSMKK